MRRLLFVAALAWMLSGCAAPARLSPDAVIISDVPPFAAQVRDDDCASVALASLLEYYGNPVPPARIDRAVYDPILGGTLLADLEDFAAEQGMQPRSGRGDLELLRDLIDKGRPVLLPIDLGWGRWKRPHYVIVFGYDRKNFLMYKRAGKATTIPANKLETQWGKNGYLYLYFENES